MYIHGVNLSLTEEQGLHHVYTWWNFVQIFYFIFLSRFSVPLLLASRIKGVSPHYFRHSHASHSLDRGASLQLVKDTLGHSSILVSERYLHAKPDDSSAMYLPF